MFCCVHILKNSTRKLYVYEENAYTVIPQYSLKNCLLYRDFFDRSGFCNNFLIVVHNRKTLTSGSCLYSLLISYPACLGCSWIVSSLHLCLFVTDFKFFMWNTKDYKNECKLQHVKYSGGADVSFVPLMLLVCFLILCVFYLYWNMFCYLAYAQWYCAMNTHYPCVKVPHIASCIGHKCLIAHFDSDKRWGHRQLSGDAWDFWATISSGLLVNTFQYLDYSVVPPLPLSA